MGPPDATCERSDQSEWPPGWHVQVVDETGSTNADLLFAAAGGAPDRSVLMAGHQTAGRGRLDRTWEAPPGANLLVSFLFRRIPAHLHQLTQRVALAARSACREVAGVEPELKWPNDLLLDGAKLAGILAEAWAVEGEVGYVVVGLGLNVGWAPPGAARIGDDGRVTPRQLLVSILEQLDLLPEDVSDVYRSALGTIGQRVSVHLPGADRPLVGTAIGVDADGRLEVLDGCAISHHVDVADVTHLRPA